MDKALDLYKLKTELIKKLTKVLGRPYNYEIDAVVNDVILYIAQSMYKLSHVTYGTLDTPGDNYFKLTVNRVNNEFRFVFAYKDGVNGGSYSFTIKP